MCFHVALHNLETDEDTYSSRRVISEVAGEGCLVNHAAYDIVRVVIDQVLLNEIVPDR